MSTKPESFQFELAADKGAADQNTQRQFVTFVVAEQRFAVDILSVREIRIWTGATRLPNARPHVRGVINLRGAIIPVLDLSVLFSVNRETTPQTQVVVIVATNGALKGLLVDNVSDILAVAEGAITALPSGETEGRNPLFSGLINGDDGLVAIIALNNFDIVEPSAPVSELAVA